MTVYWECLDCEETGTGHTVAEKHTRETGHATIQSNNPPRRGESAP